MVVDSSALIALMADEPERPAFDAAIAKAATRRISAVNIVEARMVQLSRRRQAGLDILDEFVVRAGLLIEPVTSSAASIAFEAFRQFGKGRHRAGLNFGDCFAYALARERNEPLLFKGDDFVHTDITPAAPG